jgi:hypothetical protein
MPRKMSDVARELEDLARLPPGITRDMMPADWVPPPLPHGITIKVDPRTDNIIVANEDLGFCVTRRAIADNIHLPLFRPALAQLVEILSDPVLMARVKEASISDHLAFRKADDLKHLPSPTVFDGAR